MNNKNGIKQLPDNGKINIDLTLPWPPSVNQAYRCVNGYVRKSARSRQYFKDVAWLIKAMRLTQFQNKRLKMLVRCFPPNKRKRDLDNIGKVLIDTLQNAELFYDDSQVDDLRFVRREPCAPGRVEVNIQEI